MAKVVKKLPKKQVKIYQSQFGISAKALEKLGKPPDYLSDLYMVPYTHSYLLSGFELSGFGKGPRRHACLLNGDWCWKNLWEHPLDLFAYLKKRVKYCHYHKK